MAKTPQENFDLNNAFYLHLKMFYDQNKGLIRKNYKKLTKDFLDYNDPESPGSYLRVPQFEALEMYVFLKEFLDNKPVYQLFHDWFEGEGKFEKETNEQMQISRMTYSGNSQNSNTKMFLRR